MCKRETSRFSEYGERLGSVFTSKLAEVQRGDRLSHCEKVIEKKRSEVRGRAGE